METATKQKKVNFLKYDVFKNVDGKDCYIKIRLSDPCKNGHNDFAITATIYEEGRKGDKYMISAGACHDTILEVAPELKRYIDLHLCDVNGTPMYAVENGFYFLEKGDLKALKNHLRVNDKELDYLVNNSEDKMVFAYNIVSMGLPARWKEEAKEAIAWLENMTGEKFEDNSTRLEKVVAPKKDVKLIGQRKEKGYYSPANIDKRKKEQQAKDKEAKLIELSNELDKEIKKHKDEYNVKVAILEAGLSLDNFIYYNHTNKGVFNWLSYHDQITENQFKYFLKSLNYKKLPEGITFSLGKD